MTTNNLKSKVEDVKVFLYGAEIKRRMTFDAVKGKNTAIFDGLPQNVNPESINASIEKGGILLSADFEVDSFREPFVSDSLKDLNEKLEKVKTAIKGEKNKLDLLASEEKFLDSNRKIGGNNGFDLKGLKEIEKYYNERKENIAASKAETELRLEDLQEEKDRIVKELGAYPADVVRYAGRIDVEFYAESAGKAEVTVSYFVNDAWWTPFHEIRMSDVNEPVLLSMKGNIVQTTGEDWTGVNIKLSTGNPTLGNDQPVLRPWFIDISRPRPVMRASAKMKEVAYDAVMMDEEPMENMDMKLSMAMPAAPLAQAHENQTTTEFSMPAPLDIPSSNKPNKVEISRHELKAEFFYYCVSKLDTDAFLIAKMDGWESLNLLAGEVSIFQGNEYVGKTYLDPAAIEDEMEISLGRDKGIIVTRERGNNMTSKGMIGKNVKVVREWVITVKNTRSKEVTLKLLDQVPVPVNSDITVESKEISGAELEKETGILTWNLNIPSGETVKKTIRYEVAYPKNSTVYLD